VAKIYTVMTNKKKIKYKTALSSEADQYNHPRMCAFSYMWSLAVTWPRWRSFH